MSRRARWVIVAVAVLGGAGLAAARHGPDDSDAIRYEASDGAAPEWDFVIPAGTRDQIDAGEDVEILPSEIKARVGESIRIENRDDVPYLLGPWFVGAGETVVHRFASPGVFEGECVVHPSGQIRLVVEA